jgi:hypothetical protein
VTGVEPLLYKIGIIGLGSQAKKIINYLKRSKVTPHYIYVRKIKKEYKVFKNLTTSNYTEAKRLIEELYTLPKEMVSNAIAIRKEALKKPKPSEYKEEEYRLQIERLTKEINILKELEDNNKKKNEKLTATVEKFFNNAIPIHDDITLSKNAAARKIAKAWKNHKAEEKNNTWRVAEGNRDGGGKRTRNVNKYLKNKRYAKTKRIKNHNKTKNLKKKIRNKTKKN